MTKLPQNSLKIYSLGLLMLFLTGCQTPPINPTTSQSYLDLGLSQEGQQKYQEALASYTQAIALDSQNDQAYYRKAFVEGLDASENYLASQEQSLKDYTKAIEINPTEPGYYLWRGLKNEDISNYQAALEDFNQAEKLGLTKSDLLIISRNRVKKTLNDLATAP